MMAEVARDDDGNGGCNGNLSRSIVASIRISLCTQTRFASY